MTFRPVALNNGPASDTMAAMDNLLRGTSPLELYTWLDAEDELPNWDFQSCGPFGASLAAPGGGTPLPPELAASQRVHNYFAEYNLEFFRQRRFNPYPSRLHALFLFATRTDAETYRAKHPARVFGKRLTPVTTRGPYLCSYHDANWIDYLHLPHSLDLDALNRVAQAYWSGTLVEEAGLTFMDDPWHDTPVIEALFQGNLVAEPATHTTRMLPGLSPSLFAPA